MKKMVLALGGAAVMSGCGGAAGDDLSKWMAQLRAETKPRVSPLSEPRQFIPEPYARDGLTDPFDQLRLVQALRKDRSVSGTALIDPERARRKEPLEAFPLDAVKMVGSLNKQNVPTALVLVENLLYQVRVGDHLGQNFGRILKISESDMVLRELAEDATGDWVERITTLKLQERSQ